MKNFLICCLAGAALHAQSMSLAGPSNVKAGSSANYSLSIASGGGPASFQFGLQAVAADVTSITATLSAAATNAGKVIQCGTYTAGLLLCLVYGVNTTAIPDGSEAVLTIQISRTTAAKTTTLTLTQLLEATAAGGGIAVTAPPILSVSIGSLCDVNGDGLINGADVTAEASLTLAFLQKTGPASACDLTASGTCEITDVQVVATAASGGACNAK